MDQPITNFCVGELYTHEGIYRSLGLGNAGGIRVSTDSDGRVNRALLLTSLPTAKICAENPYHDRVEGDVLVYTGMGQEGDQGLGGVNKRLLEQREQGFPIYCFCLIGSRRNKSLGAKRWKFVGLLQYIRHYKEDQVDARYELRSVCIFEFLILNSFEHVFVEHDKDLFSKVASAANVFSSTDEQLIERPSISLYSPDLFICDPLQAEQLRSRMLALAPDKFEQLVRDALICSGFDSVQVTRYSQDGGIDVNASASQRMWPIFKLYVQIQAKRWMHTVGRREVAELRGSLQPHARGAVVTTSQFSKAAIAEADSGGKMPVVLVDGFQFAQIVSSFKIDLH
jgi:HJR/Mrr/RecB family endonuclease